MIASMNALEIKNAAKSFGDKCVLREINLAVKPGEFVTIIGYSGSGKTTLISLLAGLQKPDAGEVLQEGRPVSGPGPERGMVFQNYSLLPWLTVRENIALAVEQVFPNYSKAEQEEHIMRYIKMVKLSHAVDRLPRQLSGGMRQRVSLARGLAIESQILLLDEPLSALDALTRATLQDDISEIWQETRKTVIWITNDPDEAILLADRIIPLTLGPSATLGPSFDVDLPRPRERKEMMHHAGFQKLRAELVNWLLDLRKREATTLTKKLVLPNILPEDLSTVNTLQFFNRRGPKRRDEEKTENLQVLS
jgi:nitrate/nitrite transport system ATP-binding protein